MISARRRSASPGSVQDDDVSSPLLSSTYTVHEPARPLVLPFSQKGQPLAELQFVYFIYLLVLFLLSRSDLPVLIIAWKYSCVTSACCEHCC